jgi:uncharacterized protein YkwD
MLKSARRGRLALCAAVLSSAVLALNVSPARALQPQQCPGAQDIPVNAQGEQVAANAIVCLVNQTRASHGLPALRVDADLAEAARKHSADMARRDYFSHTTPAGRTLSDRARDADYFEPGDELKLGEDLGWGSGDKARPEWIVGAWLDSPPHRRILLSPDYGELGVGVVDDAPKPTQLPGATYTMDLGVIR